MAKGGFPEAGVAFLRDLAEHNDRAWFEANRKRYEQDLKEPVKRLSEAIVGVLNDVDPRHAIDPAKAMGRIHRDVRFSKDKSPYHTHVWFAFPLAGGAKGEGAAYYFGVDPEGAGSGGGCWEPPPEKMAALRGKLAVEHAKLRRIVDAAAFRKRFGELKGEAYKKVPKPYDPDHPAGDLLKLKGVHVHGKIPMKVATSGKLLDTLAADFAMLKPLVAYLDEGLARA
jgi:uncharacterized protein (TIGR02453 family)